MRDCLYDSLKTNDVKTLTDVMAEKKIAIQAILDELSQISRDIHVPDIPFDQLDR